MRRTNRRRAFGHLQGLLAHANGAYALDDVHGVQDFVDRRNFERMARRLAQHAPGRTLLSERPHFDASSLLPQLAALPASSLGGAFARFMARNELDLNLTGAGPVAGSPQAEYAKLRHRETHDLVHVLLGLGVSPRDEVLVQAFTMAQNPRWLSLGIVLGGLVRHARAAGEPALAKDLVRAFRAGRRATFLLALPYEKMWALPLAQLRERLGVELLGQDLVEQEDDAPAHGGRAEAA